MRPWSTRCVAIVLCPLTGFFSCGTTRHNDSRILILAPESLSESLLAGDQTAVVRLQSFIYTEERLQRAGLTTNAPLEQPSHDFDEEQIVSAATRALAARGIVPVFLEITNISQEPIDVDASHFVLKTAQNEVRPLDAMALSRSKTHQEFDKMFDIAVKILVVILIVASVLLILRGGLGNFPLSSGGFGSSSTGSAKGNHYGSPYEQANPLPFDINYEQVLLPKLRLEPNASIKGFVFFRVDHIAKDPEMKIIFTR